MAAPIQQQSLCFRGAKQDSSEKYDNQSLQASPLNQFIKKIITMNELYHRKDAPEVLHFNAKRNWNEGAGKAHAESQLEHLGRQTETLSCFRG